jgi:hypothetical protein
MVMQGGCIVQTVARGKGQRVALRERKERREAVRIKG